MLHRPTITNEARELAPKPDEHGQYWRSFEPTGRACTVCPCGTSTGFVPHAEALAVIEQHHAWVAQERDGCSGLQPLRQVPKLLRRHHTPVT